jgi:hypothetical protein
MLCLRDPSNSHSMPGMNGATVLYDSPLLSRKKVNNGMGTFVAPLMNEFFSPDSSTSSTGILLGLLGFLALLLIIGFVICKTRQESCR